MYFGSVRFFKNLILLCVLAIIAASVTVAVCKHCELVSVKAQVAELQAEAEQNRAALEAWNRLASETAVGASSLYIEAEAPSYQLLYPDFYAPKPVTEQRYQSGVIYLTFDDGPTENTNLVLDVLAEKNVKATFFVTGQKGQEAEQRLREIVEQGHTLGMHTYCHDYDTIYDSVETFLEDMYQVFSMIREATGETPTVFRFAGGSINSHNSGIYQELIAEMLRRGFVPYDWNISAQDATAEKLSVDTVVQNVLSSAKGKERGIVLLHDGYYQKTTAQALGTIIDYFREKGYTFERIEPNVKPILFGYME